MLPYKLNACLPIIVVITDEKKKKKSFRRQERKRRQKDKKVTQSEVKDCIEIKDGNPKHLFFFF